MKAGESVNADGISYSLSNDTENGLVFSILTPAPEVTGVIATVDGKVLEDGAWSNKPITLKAEVNEYADTVWYRISGGTGSWTEFDNTKGVTISKYCDVELMAKDKDGKESDPFAYTVDYDDIAPVISDLRADSGEAVLPNGVESGVSVLVTDNLDQAPVLEVSVGDGTWTKAVRGNDGRYSFTVTGGTGFSLRATDHAANTSSLVLTVPAAPVASADITVLTNTVSLSWTASVDELAGVKEYLLVCSHDDQVFNYTTPDTSFVLEYPDYATWHWSVHAVNNIGNLSDVTKGQDFTVSAPIYNPAAKSDVDGDGLSDVLFVRGDDGAQGFWLTGPAEWRSTETAHPADWINLGCGDYNGDGKDDLLVRQYSTGMLGYYNSGDTSQWVELGRGVDMQWTVIA